MRSLISQTSFIYNIFLSNCFLFQTLQNTYKNIMNDEESDYNTKKNKKNMWHKKLSEPETDNLSKDIR